MRDVTQGLKQVFGVTAARLSTLSKKGGALALAERDRVRWWLESQGEGEWGVRLDWEPALEAWRPKGVTALARWRGLLGALSAALGEAPAVEADEEGQVVSLRLPCALPGVFEAAAKLEALTEALAALDAGGGLDEVAQALQASGAEPGEPWALVPTVGRVRWVEGRTHDMAALPDGGLLLIRGADQAPEEEVVRWALARRLGAEVERLTVAAWARRVAVAQGALPADDVALLAVRGADAQAAGEVLRLLGGVLPRWREGGWEALAGRPVELKRAQAGL